SLANASARLEEANHYRPVMAAAQHPAMAHLYIVNPLGAMNFLSKLFSTHPPIPERIERLRRMQFGSQTA
ncbi:MAG: M48 family metalloprotease, partial [Candidatus Sericytochromatia bacterium]|nr:M48 family metalloprotease [Candidatus Tanganyikabacteria bacterium]